MTHKATDSPWFWLLIFATAAVVGLAAIGPKHLRRQERLERMADQRARQQFQPEEPNAGHDADTATSLLPLYVILV
ncbi:MAG TPA: hypothetical protein VHV77_11815, partial [Pirellulales bacterium]|nr:hypothetical protein [Pirellulales bacterium]